MRGAVISVPANIMEVHFYNIAQSSLDELRYYLLLSQDLGYISSESSVQKGWKEWLGC